MAKKEKIHHLNANELYHHIGHKVELVVNHDWQTNRETAIELRCKEKDCKVCEPLFEIDLK